MASSYSGSDATLAIGVAAQDSTHTTISGPGTGCTGLSLSQESSSYEVTSGGLTTSSDSGYRVNSGSFSVNENTVTAPLLLGQNGRRANLSWNNGDGAKTAEAILTISRVFQERAQVVYNVEVAIDGDIS